MTPAAQIRAWLWRTGMPAPAGILSDTEHARAERFLRPADREAYRAAHAGLRLVLGRVCGQAPASLAFGSAPGGKPVLLGLDGAPEFNLSHAGGFAALAVGEVPLGLDIEAPRRIDAGVSRLVLGPAEQAELAALPRDERDAALLSAWVVKEAVGKAMGCGLDMPLGRLRVAISARHAPALHDIGWAAGEAALWQVAGFRFSAGGVGAVAARRRGWALAPGDAEALGPMAGGAMPFRVIGNAGGLGPMRHAAPG
jgi:4'-phosphopantetheinyl transferase